MSVVYARRDDQMGGMLLNLANAWGFAEKLGRQLSLNWVDHFPDRPAPRPWGELFTAAPFNVVTDRVAAPEAYVLPRTPASSLALARHPAIFYGHTSWVQLDYESRVDAESRSRRLLAKLAIHPAITEAIGATAAPYAAVHIRRGSDMIADFHGGPFTANAVSNFVKRVMPLSAYRRAVEKCVHGRVMIFSDSDALADELAAALPAHRCTLASRLPTLAHLTPTQRDFAEMILMSRATQIIGTRSNYSAFPMLYGNIPRILVHRWVDYGDLERLVNEVVPPHAVEAVMATYRRFLSPQAG